MSREQVAFGALLRRYRIAGGRTQEALAERARLSARAISDLERGVNRAPRHETLKMLVDALDLTDHQAALLRATARPEVTPPVLPVRSPSPPPIPSTELIGREDEIQRALSFMERGHARLLTLTGPSGVGKTRLAIELTAHLEQRFAEPAVFVDLSPVRAASLLPSAVAQALGLKEAGREPIAEQVHARLVDAELLLVLDNFEQIRAAAPFVADLLAGCPHIHVLVTSRAPLRVRGEQELPILPLAPLAAVALFLARAHAQLPDRELNGQQVAEICERVDRLPLAIELAAMHVKVLALPVLLERLNGSLALLREGAIDLPERQRTMRSAIAWSYELLTAGQQQCFRALGVFLGGWTLDAAEALCPRDGVLDRDEVLLALATLVDHNLVLSLSGRAATTRFGMLETLREYAVDRLRAAGEEDDARRRHARYYAEKLEAARVAPVLPSASEDDLAEVPNVRAALDWAVDSGDTVLGLRLALALGMILFISGRLSESEAWIERVLSADARAGYAAPSSLRAAVLYGASRGAMTQGDLERAARLAEEALEISRKTGDGVAASRAAAILGSLAQGQGDAGLAASYFEQARVEAQRSGNPIAIGLALLNLGENARLRGDVERAQPLLEEALQRARAAGSTWGVACGLTLLGHLARDQGEYVLARSQYDTSLRLLHGLGNLTYMAACLEGSAALALAEGNPQRAAVLCAHAAVLRERAQTPLPANEHEAFDATVEGTRSALGQPCFNDAWSQGKGFNDQQGMAFALAGPDSPEFEE